MPQYKIIYCFSLLLSHKKRANRNEKLQTG
ncbi:Uncharacterised protein [Pseudescherichia vulneris]|nr:Uncharacterised protein [Pseudescherichia vulneris]